MARDEPPRSRTNPNYAVNPPAPQIVQRLAQLCMSFRGFPFVLKIHGFQTNDKG